MYDLHLPILTVIWDQFTASLMRLSTLEQISLECHPRTGVHSEARSGGKEGQLQCLEPPGSKKVIAEWLAFLTPIATVLRRCPQKACPCCTAHKESSLTILLIVVGGGGNGTHRSQCSGYRYKKIPLQKEDSKSPGQLKGQNFLHLKTLQWINRLNMLWIYWTWKQLD